MSENLPYYLQLMTIKGLGPAKIKDFIEKGLSPQEICISFGDKTIPKEVFQEIENCQKLGISLLTLEDKEYPENLKTISDPPSVLYLKGDLKKEDRISLAIVGTRTASDYGLRIAEKLAKELSEHGITIVSGLAMGIDSAAHKGAIKSKGRTIAVFGNSLEEVHPRSNQKLAGEILRSGGCLMSEFPLGTKPEKWTFPRRNRIISGLSLGVIVVEGAQDSGALITARFGLEQGKEVFAVPGSIETNKSIAPHSLIKDGAKLIENTQDIFEELKHLLPATKEKRTAEFKNFDALTHDEKKVLDFLSLEPLHIDEISEKTDINMQSLSALLLNLELNGFIKQLPGKKFILVS
jgi:DNA processing protein